MLCKLLRGATYFIMANKSLITRSKRKTDFTHLSNKVFEAGLPPDTLGVLCYILHLPDDWVIHKTHLQKVFNVGRERMDRIFKELEDSLFLVAENLDRVGGQFVGKKYSFYDEPQLPPCAEKPLTVKPTTADTQLQRTNNNKELIYTNTPISPKGEEDFLGKKVISIEEWQKAYFRIFDSVGIVRTYYDLPKHKLKRYYDKFVREGRDVEEPLKMLQEVLKNEWQLKNKLRDASLSALFNPEKIANWIRPIGAKR